MFICRTACSQRALWASATSGLMWMKTRSAGMTKSLARVMQGGGDARGFVIGQISKFVIEIGFLLVVS